MAHNGPHPGLVEGLGLSSKVQRSSGRFAVTAHRRPKLSGDPADLGKHLPLS